MTEQIDTTSADFKAMEAEAKKQGLKVFVSGPGPMIFTDRLGSVGALWSVEDAVEWLKLPKDAR